MTPSTFVSGDSIALDADVYGLSGLAFLDVLNEAVLDVSHFATIDGDGVEQCGRPWSMTRDQMLVLTRMDQVLVLRSQRLP